MFRHVITVLTLALSACATYTEDYRDRLVATLMFSDSVQFMNEKRYPGKVLCGQYSAYAHNGFVRVTRDFLVTPDLVKSEPSETEQSIYCSENPEAGLFAQAGIGPSDGDWSALIKIRDDMIALRQGVFAYYNDEYIVPKSLEQLVAWSPSLETPQTYDPWGRPYEYRGGNAGRSLPRPRIFTLGADGKEGGRGADADISTTELPLLEHVLMVRGH